MSRSLPLGFAVALALAAPAIAAPFVTVDGTSRYIAMLDDGSLVRSAGGVNGEALIVMAGGPAKLAKLRFECTARTMRNVSSRTVASDMSISAPVASTDPASVVENGSLGASLLERACFGRQVNASGGWSVPTLSEAITAARAILARSATRP